MKLSKEIIAISIAGGIAGYIAASYLHKNIISKFIKYCENGDMENAKLLYKYLPNYILKNKIDYNTLFYNVCSNSHIDIIKWIMSLNIEIDYDIIEKIFNEACEKEYIELASYLFQKYKDLNPYNTEDIYNNFNYDCRNNHLNKTMWSLLFDVNNN